MQTVNPPSETPVEKRPIGVLFLFMTEADRVQYQFMADGLSGVLPIRVFSGAIAPMQQVLARGIPDKAIDPGRPAHVVKRLDADKANAGGLSNALRGRLNAILERDPFRSLRIVRGLVKNVRYWRNRRIETANFIIENDIDVVIAMSDVSYPIQSPLAGAKQVNCPIVVARTTVLHFQSTEDGARNSMTHIMRSEIPAAHLDKPRSAAEWLMNQIIQRKYPKQVGETIWGRLLPHQTADIAALALARCLPDQLWHIGTNWSDAILVSGDDEAQALDAHEVNGVERLTIGSVVFQKIHEQLLRRDELRREVCAELGIDPDHPIALICSLAAWEHLSATYEDQFAHLEKLFALLSRFDVQVVVTLHPLSRKSEYKRMADLYGFTVLDRQLFDAITVADMYITNDPSSTLRWGLAAGLPCNSVHFNPAGQVKKVHPEFPLQPSFEVLEQWLTEILPKCPIATADLLKPRTLPMGLIRDGLFFEHLASAICRLTDRSRSAHSGSH